MTTSAVELLRKERAARAVKSSTALADARVEYDTWYRDVDKRMRETGKKVGSHHGRITAYGPICMWPIQKRKLCGKPSKGKGLCSAHFNQVWRAEHRDRSRIRIGFVSLQQIEIFAIRATLKRNHYRIGVSADILGICYATLSRKIALYRIDTPKVERKFKERLELKGRAQTTIDQRIAIYGTIIPKLYRRRGPMLQPILR